MTFMYGASFLIPAFNNSWQWLAVGMFLSGYVYRYNLSYPWYVLSAALLVIGALFILLVDEPRVAEI